MDIKRLQKTTNLLIPRAPFGRLVREVFTTLTIKDYRYVKWLNFFLGNKRKVPILFFLKVT